MILATLALAFAPEAHACSPAPAAIVAQAPAADQQSVPVDALIRFQIGEGEIQDEVRISVSVDGEPVPGVLRTFDPEENPFKQAPLYAFDPDEDLPSDTRIDVQVDGLGNEATAFSFTTGDARIGDVALPPPALAWIDAWDGEHGDGPISSCEPSQWRDLYMGMEDVPDDPHGLGFVVVYRLGMSADTTAAAPLITHGPVAEGGFLDLYAQLPGEPDRAIEEECFIAVAFDGAGNASETSAIQCAAPMPEWQCGTGLGMFGCSSAPLTAAVGPALLALLGVGARRREDA